MSYRPLSYNIAAPSERARCTRRIVAFLALTALLLPSAYGNPVAAPVAAQEGSNWMRYTISGDATVEMEEKDVVMCSNVDDDRFELRSLGEWVIGIESPRGVGEHQARIELNAPAGQYRDDDSRTEDRAWGDGTLVLEDGGKDAMGFSIVKGTLQATEVKSEAGFSFTLELSFACPLF